MKFPSPLATPSRKYEKIYICKYFYHLQEDNPLLAYSVSKYQWATSKSNRTATLLHELDLIKSGYYKRLITPCREAYKTDRKLYNKLKSQLPAVTFCGVFDGPHKKENIVRYNHFVIVDLDHIDSLNIPNIKNKLITDPYIIACWVSPSGAGIKVLFKVESELSMHRFCFDRISDYLYAQYNLEVDASGSDVCRLCFVSDDPMLLYKQTYKAFPMHEEEWLYSLLSNENAAKIKANNFDREKRKVLYAQSERALLFKTEGRNRYSDREMYRKILTYLRKNNLSITSRYKDWLKVALAIANTFTFEVGSKSFMELCRLDGDSHDEYKSEQLIAYCYIKRKPGEITFASLVYLAKQKGFVVSSIRPKKK